MFGEHHNLSKFLNPQDICSAQFPFIYLCSYVLTIYYISMKKNYSKKFLLIVLTRQVYSQKVKNHPSSRILKMFGEHPNLSKFLNPQDICSAKFPFIYLYSYVLTIYCISINKFKDKKNRLHHRRHHRHRQIKPWLNFTPPKLVLHFLEYSRNIPWNIPYSKIFNISLVYIFFWNIPGIFHIPNNSTFFLFQDFLEYSIFQKIQDFLCCKFFWNMT